VSGAIVGWRLPVPVRHGAQLRAMAARILSGRQFHPAPSLWQRALNWLSRHLHLPSVQASGPSGHWLSGAVLLVLVAAVAVVAALAFRSGAFGRLSHPRHSLGVVVTDDGELLSPDAWRRQAAYLSAEGRYREALRCRYRALVGDLAALGVVTEVPGRTSGDYERLVSALVPAVAAPFFSVTRLFEGCWYGDEPSDARAQTMFDEMASAIVGAVSADRQRTNPARPQPVGVR
jgi:hypothetical protein